MRRSLGFLKASSELVGPEPWSTSLDRSGRGMGVGVAVWSRSVMLWGQLEEERR